MTAHLRRTGLPDVGRGAVDRAMRVLGLEGVRRAKGVRTTNSSLGMIPPIEYEQAHYAALNREPEPV